MKVCGKCKREMKCTKNGVGLDFGGGHIYAGDRWECPGCGAEVIVSTGVPSFDPDHRQRSEYVDMSGGKGKGAK